MITIRISKDGERIGVFCPPSFSERCRMVPGYTWNGEAKAWVYPANPSTAVSLNAIFAHQNIKIDDAFSLLLKNGTSVYRNASAMMNVDSSNLQMPPLYRRDRPLWAHQLRAFWYTVALWGGLDNPHSGGGVMIPLKMGRGKTSVAIHLIANFKFERVLIITPPKVVNVWAPEFELNDPLGCHVISLREGSVKYRTKLAEKHLNEIYKKYPGKPAVIVTNYEAARTSYLAEFTLNHQWDCTIADESHRLKSYKTLTSKYFALLSRRSKHRLALTGTPMPHSPLDLFAQYRFLDISIFGTSWTRHRSTYADMGGWGGKEVVAYKNQDLLSEKFYSIAYRIKPEEDVVARELPVVITRKVLLDKEYAPYWDMYNHMVSQLKDGTLATAQNTLVKLLRLQQITSGFIRDEYGKTHRIGTSKPELLADVLEDLDLREPIVIFCLFHESIDICKEVCEKSGRTVSELSGRVDNLANWKNGDTDVLVAQIQSGKEGISLVRAQYSIYYNATFSLADYDQSVARTDRPGQSAERVTVIRLVAENTIDQLIYDAITKRRDIVNYIMELAKAEKTIDPV
jgi:SNF2 family DNA or RNA helicase